MKTGKPKELRVAVLVDTSRSYGRRLLRGMIAYQRDHQRWHLHIEAEELVDPVGLRQWTGDGILARTLFATTTRAVEPFDIPRVYWGQIPRPLETTAPLIMGPEVDRLAVAQLVAEHLCNCGLRSMAAYGKPFDWSHRWLGLFVDAIKQRGIDCPRFPSPVDGEFHTPTSDQLIDWLNSLPKPVGIMAVNDETALEITEACAAAGLRVPDDVAVLGADNDDLTCEISNPPLSSVALPVERMGYLGAQMLDDLMHGRKSSVDTNPLAPLGVVHRRSTDVMNVDDEVIAAAMRYIRNHANQKLQVPDVVKHSSLNRRKLEKRFLAVCGFSVRDDIERVRIQRAMSMLKTTNAPVPVVARQCGYRNPQRLAEAFRRQTGQSPVRFRKQ